MCFFLNIIQWTCRFIHYYKYSGYGIGFDGIEFDKNVIIFGADMSSSVHIDNKNKDISILGKGPMQKLSEFYKFY